MLEAARACHDPQWCLAQHDRRGSHFVQCLPRWPARSPPERSRSRRTCCSSRSTRCAPIALGAYGYAAAQDAGARPLGRGGRQVCRCHRPRAADLPVARRDPDRPLPRELRHPAQRHGPTAGRGDHDRRAPESAPAIAPAPSSAASCSSGASASIRDSTSTTTASTSGRRETVAVADLQRPASDVTDCRRGLAEVAHRRKPRALVPVGALLRPAPAVCRRRRRTRRLAAGRPYDGEVAFVDAEIGRLLASVDRSRTVVVVTADHGESLGDHGESDHGLLPVRLDAAGAADRRWTAGQGGSRRASSPSRCAGIDIAPTIAALAGLATELSRLTARASCRCSRGGLARDVPVSLAESWYPRLHFGWSELRSARVGEWKYIAAPKPELYDLRSDRVEAKNLSTTAPPWRVGWPRRSDGWRALAAKVPATPSAQPDPATVERLQALGYVGSFAPVTAGSGADNPLDRLADYRAYRDLFSTGADAARAEAPARSRGHPAALVKHERPRVRGASLSGERVRRAVERRMPRSASTRCAALLNPSLAHAALRGREGALRTGRASTRPPSAAVAGLEREPRSFYGHYTLGVVHQKARPVAGGGGGVLAGRRDQPARPARARRTSRGRRCARAISISRRAQFERMIELGYQVRAGAVQPRRDRGQTRQIGRGRAPLQAGAQGGPPFKPARRRSRSSKVKSHPAMQRSARARSRGGARRDRSRPALSGASFGAHADRSSTPVGRGPRPRCRAACSPNDLNVIAHHARHDALGPHRRVRRRRRVDAQPRSAGRRGRAVRAGHRAGAAHAARALDALHGPAAAEARRPRQRRLRARSQAPHAGDRAEGSSAARRAASSARSCSTASSASTRVRYLLRPVRRLAASVRLARRASRARPAKSSTTRCPGSRSTPAAPFFAWLHFYDAHSPYDAARAVPVALPRSAVRRRDRLRRRASGPRPRWLDAHGLADRTVVVVIGDHGESLNEHGEATHGLFIYESTTRVPFMSGRRIRRRVGGGSPASCGPRTSCRRCSISSAGARRMASRVEAWRRSSPAPRPT